MNRFQPTIRSIRHIRHIRRIFSTLPALGFLLLGSPAHAAHAANPEQAKGLWLSADKAAVIEFKECSDNKDNLCGKIVWDKDAGTPDDACGVLIAKLKKYDDEAWRDGWVYDPRPKKYYKGVIRVKDDTLQVRAFVGVEILGETEQMTRVASLPAGCKKQ
jgi:uncharacterized protein (DUF2147 family)